MAAYLTRNRSLQCTIGPFETFAIQDCWGQSGRSGVHGESEFRVAVRGNYLQLASH
jgi:hypothetical protein